MDYTINDVIYLPFTTRAFATGIPTALAGSPTVEIYEDASVTPIVEGVGKLVLTISLNSIAGFNMATATLSAANGFEAGKHYTLIIKTGTVGGVSVVGEVVGEFTIQWSAAAVDLANGTDGLGAIKAETALILADTGTTIPGTITTLQADTDDIQTRLPAALVGGRMDSNASAISGAAVTADRLEAWLNGFLTGTVEQGAGPTTTVFQTDAAELTDDHFNNSVIAFTGGALLGQARRISDYTGATGTMTVDPALTEAPAAGDTWIVFPMVLAGIDSNGRVDVGRWLGTAVTLSATTAKPEVDIRSVSDDFGAANNLEADYDGTGFTKGNSVIAQVTTANSLGAQAKLDVNAQADTAISDANLATAAKLQKYVQLLARSDAAIETDNATELTEINANGGSGLGDYSAQTDSLEASQAEHDVTQSAVTAVDDFVDTEVGDILTDTGTTIPAQITALNNLSAAEVKTQVVAALNTDTYAEPGQGAPPATATLVQKLGYLYKSWRNLKDNNGSVTNLYNDAGTVVDQKQTVSEAAGTVTKAEWVTGP